jgi:hypothetical protein
MNGVVTYSLVNIEEGRATFEIDPKSGTIVLVGYVAIWYHN